MLRLLSLAGLLLLLLLAAPLALAQGQPQLRLEIEGKGTIVIELNTREAPRTTAHIMKLAREGFYNGQRFHRVVKSPKPYLIQVGDPNSRNGVGGPGIGSGGSGASIPIERNGLTHRTGAVGLALKTNASDQGDSQFYIMLAPASFLDGQYTVFGQVVQGMDVVNRIALGDRISSATIVGG